MNKKNNVQKRTTDPSQIGKTSEAVHKHFLQAANQKTDLVAQNLLLVNNNETTLENNQERVLLHQDHR